MEELGLLELLVGFLLGVVGTAVGATYQQRLSARAREREVLRALRVELEQNLARLSRHVEERWPSRLEESAWHVARSVVFPAGTEANLVAAYLAIDAYNADIAQQYKLGTTSSGQTQDFLAHAAQRVDAAPVRTKIEAALGSLGRTPG